MGRCAIIDSVQAFDHINALATNLEKERDSSVFFRSIVDPHTAFCRIGNVFSQVFYWAEALWAKDEVFLIQNQECSVKLFDEASNICALRKIFQVALGDELSSVDTKTQRVFKFALRVDERVEACGASKSAHDMVVEHINKASSIGALQKIFSALSFCDAQEKQFFAGKIFTKLQEPAFLNDSTALVKEMQSFLPQEEVVSFMLEGWKKVALEEEKISFGGLKQKVSVYSKTLATHFEREKTASTTWPLQIQNTLMKCVQADVCAAILKSLKSVHEVEMLKKDYRELEKALLALLQLKAEVSILAQTLHATNEETYVSLMTVIEAYIAETRSRWEGSRSRETPASTTRSSKFLSENRITINIGSHAFQIGQAVLTTALMTSMATQLKLPVPGGIIGSVALSLAMGVGSSLVSKTWTKVSMIIDAQCDKLPRRVATPTKWAWRIAACAAPILCYAARQAMLGSGSEQLPLASQLGGNAASVHSTLAASEKTGFFARIGSAWLRGKERPVGETLIGSMLEGGVKASLMTAAPASALPSCILQKTPSLLVQALTGSKGVS